MSITEKFNDYVSKHIFDPNYAKVSVFWKDNKDRVEGLIISLTDFKKEEDDKIFYYCDSIKDLESLTKEDGKSEFVVIEDSVEFVDFFEKL